MLHGIRCAMSVDEQLLLLLLTSIMVTMPRPRQYDWCMYTTQVFAREREARVRSDATSGRKLSHLPPAGIHVRHARVSI